MEIKAVGVGHFTKPTGDDLDGDGNPLPRREFVLSKSDGLLSKVVEIQGRPDETANLVGPRFIFRAFFQEQFTDTNYVVLLDSGSMSVLQKNVDSIDFFASNPVPDEGRDLGFTVIA